MNEEIDEIEIEYLDLKDLLDLDDFSLVDDNN